MNRSNARLNCVCRQSGQGRRSYHRNGSGADRAAPRRLWARPRSSRSGRRANLNEGRRVPKVTTMHRRCSPATGVQDHTGDQSSPLHSRLTVRHPPSIPRHSPTHPLSPNPPILCCAWYRSRTPVRFKTPSCHPIPPLGVVCRSS